MVVFFFCPFVLWQCPDVLIFFFLVQTSRQGSGHAKRGQEHMGKVAAAAAAAVGKLGVFKLSAAGTAESKRPPLPTSATRARGDSYGTASSSQPHSSAAPTVLEGIVLHDRGNGAEKERRAASRYKGVTWDRVKRMWRVRLCLAGGARQHVGYYLDEEEGAVAYVHALSLAKAQGLSLKNET
eukprot:Tamp_12463.p1 GENE.Tamp_12463~~Tamp_12463.p1  ORF type:complete len:182 (+),score=28.41 Tamp_12463:81-626(+)